jgi:putative ABC transport system permease protein
MALALMIEIGDTTSKELLDADQQTRANTYVAIKVLDALNQNLDEQTQNALDVYQDKETLVNMIVGMSGAIPGTDLEALKASLLARELDELKAMIRPSIEAAITSQIINATKQQIETTLTEEQRAAALTTDVSAYSIEQFVLYYDEITEFSTNDYQSTMTLLGNHELSTPFSINIFASSFENKDVIVDAIATYNSGVDKTRQISYTDYLGIMMSSITTVIDAISYVLIAFVSISLIVSSIMIGVITLISVQERTKEIGILRAIGASKRDVSSMFNAETMIIGFSSGFLGVAVTYLLCIPINAILKAATGLANLRAILPIGAALILIAISVALTLISGLIPSKSAAKKDPVVALRSE